MGAEGDHRHVTFKSDLLAAGRPA
jgi:CHASE domain-containing protein